MTPQALATLGILAAGIAAFTLGPWRPDLIAVGILLVLALARILSPEQAFAGFGTPAVVAVAAILVVSAGLERTGLATLLGRPLRRLAGRSRRRLLFLLMGTTGLLAGIMNNLAALAVLMPVTVSIAGRRRISPTRLLLPLAYAARFGGNLTLIAGPSNLLLGDILRQRHLADLHLFAFLPIGLPMLIVGTAWMVAAGDRFLPGHPPEALLRATRRRARLVRVYRLSERLFEALIPSGSPIAGRTIEDSEFGRAFGLTIVSVTRGDRQILSPAKSLRLREGDRLAIAGRLDELLEAEALERAGLVLGKADRFPLDSSEVGVVEAVVSPRSAIAGRSLREMRFRDRYSLTVLALWREGRPMRTRFADVPLRVGDGLLLQGPWRHLQALRDDPDFIVLEEEMTPAVRTDKVGFAVLAVVLLVALSLAGVPVALSSMLAAGVMVFAGALTIEEAYRAIDWRSIVLMGAMLPLGVALEETGAARAVASALAAGFGGMPVGALAAVLLMATAVGHFVPSVATTALLAPVALDLAGVLGLSPLPFAMALIAATGLTVLTPFSSPVMLMVMSPGGYRVRDYVRSGLPVMAILLLLMLGILPLAFPF